MNTINQKRTQLSVFAVAALTIVAVAAVMLLAGGVPARAGNLLAPSGSATNAPPQPQQTAPEACAAGEPIPVYGIGDGAKRLALFDVYWDTDKKNLFNNPCPPTVTWVPDGQDADLNPIPAHESRAASDVDIRRTIIHIPSSYKQTLKFDPTSVTPDEIKYPFMFEDWNLEDTDSDGDNDALVNDSFWVLPTCDPNYTDTDGTDPAMPQTEAAAGADDLCLIFSAALLDQANWVSVAKGTVAGDIQFEFESIREPDLAPDDRGYGFAFLPYNVAGVTPQNQVTWRTANADQNELMITPGTYEYRQWGFAKPGTYVFSVHAKGHPRDHLTHGHTVETETSKVVEYTIHVGLLAELNTRITADNTTPDVGDTVELTVTARNEGPSAGRDVKVQVGGSDGQEGLPEGLTYVSHEPTTADYDNGTGEWDVGNMDVPDEGVDATTATLTITATVDDGTRGRPLEVTAIIGGTETIGGSKVDELDPHIVHHSASVTITPVAVINAPAELYLKMDVPENSAAGTDVGSPIPLRGIDPGDEIDPNLVGSGDHLFEAVDVNDTVQVRVKTGANLDFEWGGETVYDLILQVSDGKSPEGNPNPSVDSKLPVQINVTDDRTEPFAARLGVSNTMPTVGDESVVFTLTLDNELPIPLDQMSWTWNERYEAQNGGYETDEHDGEGDPGTTVMPRTVPDDAGVRQYWIYFWHYDDQNNFVRLAESNGISINWQAASN